MSGNQKAPIAICGFCGPAGGAATLRIGYLRIRNGERRWFPDEEMMSDDSFEVSNSRYRLELVEGMECDREVYLLQPISYGGQQHSITPKRGH